MNVLVISAEEIERHDCLPETIPALRSAFADLHAESVVMPPRTIITTSPADPHRQLLTMPAVLARQDMASVKVTTLTPANPARGLPLIHGVVTLLDLSTGQILSILEGAAVTAVRTGAMSGLATQILAREDARTLAIIGAGVQARTQLRGVAAVRDIDTVFLFSRTPARTASFAEWITAHDGLNIRVHICASPREAVEQADIICTATSTDSRTPLLAQDWIRPGTHLNAIGGVDEHACEIDPSILRTAYPVVEQSEAALNEAGEIRDAVRQGFLSPADIVELGSVIVGDAPARVSPDQITVFRSVGIAIQDTVASQAIFQRVKRAGGGTQVSF